MGSPHALETALYNYCCKFTQEQRQCIVKNRSIQISTLCLLLFNLETFEMNLLYLSNNSRIDCHVGGFLPKHYILLGKHSLVTPLPGARFKVWQLSSVCVCVCVCVCAKHQLFWLLLHLLCALKKLQTFLEVGKILSSQYKFSYLLIVVNLKFL